MVRWWIKVGCTYGIVDGVDGSRMGKCETKVGPVGGEWVLVFVVS